jgi:NADPH:quinone reductase-like Zn-dependent oxidoreductase
MKAIVRERYGSPDVLELQEIDQPVVKDDEVLVRVLAASVNPYDWHMMTGTPYLARLMDGGLRKPKLQLQGLDMAGRVEAVGRDVTEFQPGDEVFGMRSGAFAEYVCVRESRMVLKKPASLTFEQAAAVPLAALTALQGLRDKGRIQSGQKVLVNGASGGVGTFAVQIAKSYGADVTGVCSTRNVDLVRSIGADHVIDYTREDFRQGEQRYDLILDMAGSGPLSARTRALSSDGTLVAVGGPVEGLWIAPLTGALKMLAASKVGGKKMVGMLTRQSRDDLAALHALLEAGKVTPVIDRRYPLSEVPEALAYLGKGHARGKVVITV